MADTEQRILEAAHTVFVRKGTAGARMQDVARAAGVNQALLHYYFRNKARLSEAVFQRAAHQLLPKIFEVMASDAELPDKIRQVVAIELDQLSRTPYLPGYIISELTHRPERASQLFSNLTGVSPDAVRARVLETVRRQIDAGVRARTMRRIAPEQFLVNLISLCIFPFAARPLIGAILGLGDEAFARFIADRKRDLPAFVTRALLP